jgi:hypothetical protein
VRQSHRNGPEGLCCFEEVDAGTLNGSSYPDKLPVSKTLLPEFKTELKWNDTIYAEGLVLKWLGGLLKRNIIGEDGNGLL